MSVWRNKTQDWCMSLNQLSINTEILKKARTRGLCLAQSHAGMKQTCRAQQFN